MELVGMGGSEVKLEWKEIQPGSGEYGAVIKKMPELLCNKVRENVLEVYNKFRAEFLNVTETGYKKLTENLKEYNKLIESGVCTSLQLNTSIGKVVYVWNKKDLEVVKKKYTHQNLDKELSSLGKKQGALLENAIMLVISALKSQLNVFDPLLSSEKISTYTAEHQPAIILPQVSNLPLIKSLAYEAIKNIKVI